MERNGFVALSEEWWHYDYGGWDRFPLLDVPVGRVDQVRPRPDVWRAYPPVGRLLALLPLD